MTREILHCPNLTELSRGAATLVVKRARQCVAERGLFTLVLSGGKTPLGLYEMLGQPPYLSQMPWAETHLFWGDERCVPPDSPHSNFGAAQATMLVKAPLPPENIHRMQGELPPPQGAEAYQVELQQFFGATSDCFPPFDLVLLGMGANGHTASLFPGSPLLEETQRWVVFTPPGGEPPLSRLTLSFPVINQAREVLFLVSGENKREAVRAILASPDNATHLPAARVHPQEHLCWMLDDSTLSDRRG
ncbi:MAG: 6-phosphogluconolactonase [candidate division WS1 bacterium]|nr:6-phosphogluconolactonase [candidate division WS1 bacterium]